MDRTAAVPEDLTGRPRRVATGQTIDIGACRLVVVAAAEGETTEAAKGPSNAA